MTDRILRSLSILAVALLAAAAPAQTSLDIGGWTLNQEVSTQTYTIPTGTTVEPGGWVIICRDQDQAEFESYYGVTLGSNVTYLRSSNTAPMINGDETYELRDASDTSMDGPTVAIDTTRRSYHRSDPETQAWSTIDETPTPGSGVEAADGTYSGLVITEVTDPDSYTYEFVELYYDADTGSSPDAPSISGVSVTPSAPVHGDALTVSATVTEGDEAISTVVCYYRTDGGTFLSQTMSSTGGDVYAADFGAQVGDVDFDYYVTATDAGADATSAPADAPTSWYTVHIDAASSGTGVILFDHSHDQDAGSNGNWRIDDNYPDPSPAEPTSETSWSGQLSEWAYELYLAGHTVRSNTDALSAAVLAGVDVLVIPEPQNVLTAAEREAVRQFVYDGGGLFMIADHNSSDRNSNGWDSPSIFGGYTYPHITDPVGSDTETFAGALFGLHFHVKDEGNNSISGTYDNITAASGNPITEGDYGDVEAVIYHVGNVMTLWPTANSDLSDVGALVSKDDGSPHMAAWSRYGDGRVVGYGDSSSMADGTGSESHEDNWTESGANHREFFLNATMWLMGDLETGVEDVPYNLGLDLRAYPNPFNPRTTVGFTMPRDGRVTVTVHDLKGRAVRTLFEGTLPAGAQALTLDGYDDAGRPLASGVYLVRASGVGLLNWTKVVLAK